MEGYNGKCGGATVIDRYRHANFTWAGCNRKKIVKHEAGDVLSIALKRTQWDWRRKRLRAHHLFRNLFPSAVSI
jgi:hypothetical protein